MALQKSIDTESGAAATYWRIVRVEFDLLARTVLYFVAGYVSAEARLAGKTPLQKRSFLMELAAGVAPEDMTRAALYEHVKSAVPFPGAEAPFAGAEDV